MHGMVSIMIGGGVLIGASLACTATAIAMSVTTRAVPETVRSTTLGSIAAVASISWCRSPPGARRSSSRSPTRSSLAKGAPGVAGLGAAGLAGVTVAMATGGTWSAARSRGSASGFLSSGFFSASILAVTGGGGTRAASSRGLASVAWSCTPGAAPAGPSPGSRAFSGAPRTPSTKPPTAHRPMTTATTLKTLRGMLHMRPTPNADRRKGEFRLRTRRPQKGRSAAGEVNAS